MFSAKSSAGRTKPVDAHFKQLLREFIQENPGLSGDEYARQFIKLYSDEMKNLRHREYGHRIVADWARRILRAQKDAK